MSIDELADLSTVEEAARFLRIGRGMAYRAARRYLDSGGEQGLPVIQLGRHLRLPKPLLSRLLTGELHLDGPPPTVTAVSSSRSDPTAQQCLSRRKSHQSVRATVAGSPTVDADLNLTLGGCE